MVEIKNELSTSMGSRVKTRLPQIKFENYTNRKAEFLKVDDDPQVERFVAFNCFPKNLTKGYVEAPKGVPNISKYSPRVTVFDEAAKPKYGDQRGFSNFASVKKSQ